MVQERPQRGGIRPEIQLLRAIAVGFVVIFHLWPLSIPGGYAGVDVFFVVSGFLITAHLLREVDRTGRIRLREFWARRARRLLPAALLVLLITAVAVILFIPTTFWSGFFRNIIASTLYVGNWQLAFDSIDYLAADAAVSPAQHYWSLSVEEQFYLVWPLLILLGVGIAARAGASRRRLVIAATLGTVTLASLVYSVVFTATDPSFAYFSTPVRAWEFGAGGLLAMLPVLRAHRVISIGISLVGIGLLAAAASLLNAETPFPGYAALLPVVGTVLVIVAGTPAGWYGRVVSFRPLQWLGDISYSTYLWHWPIIVTVGFVYGTADVPMAVSLGMLVVTILLAWLTKKFVEDPVRTGRLARAKSWRTYVATLVAMCITSVPAAGGIAAIEIERARVNAEWLALTGDPCLGAPALDAEVRTACAQEDALGDALLPPPASLTEDTPEIWDPVCRMGSRESEVRDCHYPPSGEATATVAVVGESHMAQWFSALQPIAEARGWDLHVLWKSGCPFNSRSRIHDNLEFLEACAEWNRGVIAELESLDPDVVITSGQTLIEFPGVDGEPSTQEAIDGYVEQWQAVVDLGIRLVVLEDTPRVLDEQLACAADPEDLLYDCVRSRDEAIEERDGVLSTAAERVPEAVFLDLTDAFCTEDECPTVLGHTIVYRDSNSHFTATFGATLPSIIGPRIVEAVTG